MRIVTAVIILSISLLFLNSCKKTGEKELRSPGEIAFRSSCQSCHALPKPQMKTDQEWPALVNRYGERAHLSQSKIEDIISFLIANN